jgi:muramoyltetrapeptide carboxypeptidase
MHIIKPKALKRGDVIGIAAPASPPTPREKLNKGIRYLEQLGYRVELGSHINNRKGYLAGSDRDRASDLHQLFGNRKVKAIFTARGGYGCQRLLPLLDYRLIRRNPKILVGYSDITALQLALSAKTGLVTFSGPMVASEMATGLNSQTEEQFWECLTSTKRLPAIQTKKRYNIFSQSRSSVTGRLLGGNLTLITMLLGTPYFPSLKNSILFLEEIGEQPYRIDRMLQKMKLAGILKEINGVMLGAFINCNPEKGKPSLKLQKICQDIFHQTHYPIISGFPYGHIKDSVTLPLGIRARLDALNRKVEFLELCVA